MELFQVARSYDFSDVQVTVGGLRIGGFGEAGGVNIEPQSEISMMKMGADGEVVISKLPLPSYVVTLTLMETSVSNGTLAGLLMIQRNAPSGFVLPFAMLDTTSGETVLAGQCVFQNLPSITKNKEASEREWKLGLPKATVIMATV